MVGNAGLTHSFNLGGTSIVGAVFGHSNGSAEMQAQDLTGILAPVALKYRYTLEYHTPSLQPDVGVVSREYMRLMNRNI